MCVWIAPGSARSFLLRIFIAVKINNWEVRRWSVGIWTIMIIQPRTEEWSTETSVIIYQSTGINVLQHLNVLQQVRSYCKGAARGVSKCII